MMRRAFEELSYRRFEWKCDSLNAASRQAAERFGFKYEGTFKNHMIYQGRSRNTSWYSVICEDWEKLKLAYQNWLAPQNFDEQGQQITKLADLVNRR